MYLSLSTHSVFAKWFKGGNCKSCLCLFPRALGALKWYLFLDQGRLLQLISSNPSPESIKSREPMYRLHCYCPCSLFSSERERASNLSPQPPLSFPAFFPFALTPLSSHFRVPASLHLPQWWRKNGAGVCPRAKKPLWNPAIFGWRVNCVAFSRIKHLNWFRFHNSKVSYLLSYRCNDWYICF